MKSSPLKIVVAGTKDYLKQGIAGLHQYGRSPVLVLEGEERISLHKDKIQAIGKDVLFNYFTQINDNTMKVFN